MWQSTDGGVMLFIPATTELSTTQESLSRLSVCDDEVLPSIENVPVPVKTEPEEELHMFRSDSSTLAARSEELDTEAVDLPLRDDLYDQLNMFAYFSEET